MTRAPGRLGWLAGGRRSAGTSQSVRRGDGVRADVSRETRGRDGRAGAEGGVGKAPVKLVRLSAPDSGRVVQRLHIE